MTSLSSDAVSHCFFLNDTATTEIYTLSLHDALPIFRHRTHHTHTHTPHTVRSLAAHRSEEHTSELQSHLNLVCRLLLAKNKILRSIPRRWHIVNTTTHHTRTSIRI